MQSYLCNSAGCKIIPLRGFHRYHPDCVRFFTFFSLGLHRFKKLTFMGAELLGINLSLLKQVIL